MFFPFLLRSILSWTEKKLNPEGLSPEEGGRPFFVGCQGQAISEYLAMLFAFALITALSAAFFTQVCDPTNGIFRQYLDRLIARMVGG